MPPQQPDRLLDLIDDGFNLGTHFSIPDPDVARAI
jgi:hypothetical protein